MHFVNLVDTVCGSAPLCSPGHFTTTRGFTPLHFPVLSPEVLREACPGNAKLHNKDNDKYFSFQNKILMFSLFCVCIAIHDQF